MKKATVIEKFVFSLCLFLTIAASICLADGQNRGYIGSRNQGIKEEQDSTYNRYNRLIVSNDTLSCTAQGVCNLDTGGGGGTSVFVNTVEVENPDFTDSNDIDFNVAGSTITTDVNYVDIGASGVTKVAFDATAGGPTLAEGELAYNSDDRTLDFGLGNGVTINLPEEATKTIQNNTGTVISDGRPVMFAGTVGASGTLLGQYAIADDSIPAEYTIGITTESIINGSSGKVTTDGKVRGIQTNGANFGESWVDEDLLYISPTTAGYLTNVKPNAPNRAILVAVVVSAHATNGTLEVRPTWNSKFVDLDDVNGTELTTSGQIPVWDNANQYFDFTEDINDYYKMSGAANQTIRFSGTDTLAASSALLNDGTHITIANDLTVDTNLLFADASENVVSITGRLQTISDSADIDLQTTTSGDIVIDAINVNHLGAQVDFTDDGGGSLVTQDQHLTLQDNAASTVILDDEATQNGALAGGDNTADITTTSGLPSGIARGLALDGSADYINTQNNFDTSQDGWVTFWFNHDNTNSNDIVWGFQSPTDNDRFYVRIDSDGTLRIGLGNNSSDSTYSPSTGTPQWWKIVWTASSDTMTVFVDDVQRHSYSNTIGNLTEVPFVGALNYHGGVSAYADGTVTDYRTEAGILSSANSDIIYANGNGTIGNGSAGAVDQQGTVLAPTTSTAAIAVTSATTNNRGVAVHQDNDYFESQALVNTFKNGLDVVAGDIDITLGNINITQGDVVLSDGSITVAGTEDSNFDNVLYIDVANARLGVNDTTPDYELDVVGDGNIEGNLYVKGGLQTSYASKTSNYTVTLGDNFMACDATSGDVTFTLPTAASAYDATDTRSIEYTFKKIDSSTNSCIVDGNGSETIDDATTQDIIFQYDSLTIRSDGDEWYIK